MPGTRMLCDVLSVAEPTPAANDAVYLTWDQSFGWIFDPDLLVFLHYVPGPPYLSSHPSAVVGSKFRVVCRPRCGGVLKQD